jgi:lysophospholipid acyltransferase (LPLAT)-like uncharacterized protein
MARLRSPLKSRAALVVGGWLAGALVALLRASLRTRDEAPEETRRLLASGGPVIGCFWHGRLLCTLGQGMLPPGEVHFLVSPHRDGLLLATALRRIGCRPLFGSSGREGAKGLAALTRAVGRQSKIVAITPDGPRGPTEEAKLGAVKLAQLTGAPLLPLSASARPAWRAGSWDAFLLPLPFARAAVHWGEAFQVPREAADAELEEYRVRLEAALKRLDAAADAAVGRA